jgi:hypothetical protein
VHPQNTPEPKTYILCQNAFSDSRAEEGAVLIEAAAEIDLHLRRMRHVTVSAR